MSALARWRANIPSPPRLVAGMLVVATLLALVMALHSAINDRPELWRGPPDEANHRGAARYYVDHWLPPRVGDPATLESYSRDYGFSYINDPDLVYFFAGKFAALLSLLGVAHDTGFRLFNVFLLGLVAAFSWKRPEAWPLCLPLAISPQIWYVFSYFNGDAFALFLCVVLAGQIALRGSGLNRFLDGEAVRRTAGGLLVFGASLGLLLLSKKNFQAFVLLIPALLCALRFGPASGWVVGLAAPIAAAWYLYWVPLQHPDKAWAGAAAIAATALVVASFLAFRPVTERKARVSVAARLAALAMVALALVGIRHVVDLQVNGSAERKQAAVIELQEKMAKPEYKPSVVAVHKPTAFYGMELRARGVPLSALFQPPWHWHSRMFITATGSYGWLEFAAHLAYYFLMAAGYLALFGAYAWAVTRSRDATLVTSFVLTIVFGALTVGVALYHSWVNDFQAQGRYLFPIVAMLGLGLQLAKERLPTRWVMGAAFYCFVLGVYSFVFVGLARVPSSF